MSESTRREFLIRTTLAGATAMGWCPFGGCRSTAAPTDTPAATASGEAPVPLEPPDKQPPELEVPTPVPRKAGWAIVGLGKLALEEVLPAFGECVLSKPVALVSGHPEKARQVAEVYGINSDAIYGYQNYDEIAKNDAIDIVYIILPNSLHADYTIRALRSGKHVLCEKPMGVNVEECERMIGAARDAQRKLMIAYRLHYEPFNRKVIELCEKKALGEIKTFSSSNCQDVEAPNIRLSAKLGGGPLGDIGIYCINAARYVTGEEPLEVTAIAHQPSDDPRFREVSESFTFTLRFPSGVLAHCDCSFGAGESRRYRVNCAKGFIDLDSAYGYWGQELHVKQGHAKAGDAQSAKLLLEPVNHFSAEMDHFSGCVLDDKECRTPGEMGLADVRVIAAIEEAARTGRSVQVGL